MRLLASMAMPTMASMMICPNNNNAGQTAKKGQKMITKFTVTGYDRYEPFDEIEKEFDRLEDAQSLSSRIIDDGGYATITDEYGNEYNPYP